jgi:hypothetical protein
MTKMRHFALLGVLCGFWGAILPQHVAAQTAPVQNTPSTLPDVDLKLFDKAEVDLTKGCSVALWQANRDRDKDRYAYIFLEQLYGKNSTRQVARIKIGTQVVTMTRVATGGKSNGFGLYDYQLYKLPNDGEFVILDIKQGEMEGEAVSVESGTMSVIMKGKNVFRVSVLGGAGCYGAPIPAPSAAPPAQKVQTPPPPKQKQPVQSDESLSNIFSRYAVQPSQVPRAFTQAVQKKFNCEPDFMKTGIIGFQMSEESAIWQVPCERFAYQTNAIFAHVYLPDPAIEHKFLSFQNPKGGKRSSVEGTLIDPEWDVKKRVVTSVSLGRGQGDCGTLERHRVTSEGKFELIEYREKKNCDGKIIKPENFPLVFQAR